MLAATEPVILCDLQLGINFAAEGSTTGNASSTSSSGGGLSGGAVAGIVVGVALGMPLLLLGLSYARWRHRWMADHRQVVEASEEGKTAAVGDSEGAPNGGDVEAGSGGPTPLPSGRATPMASAQSLPAPAAAAAAAAAASSACSIASHGSAPTPGRGSGRRALSVPKQHVSELHLFEEYFKSVSVCVCGRAACLSVRFRR